MDNEVWKRIEYPGLESYYEVSNLGSIRIGDREIVDKNGTIYHKKSTSCKVSVDSSGRLKFSAKKSDGGSVTKYVDYFVAKAFVQNPSNYPSLEHIDGILSNNNANNLQWVDAEINPKYRIIQDLDNEEWKVFPDNDMYCVSNLGRVKVLPKNVKFNSDYTIPRFETLLNPILDDKSGYCSIAVQINNKTRLIKLHKLVASLFIPNPNNKTDVEHLNHNKLDNRVENLQWITKGETNDNSTAIDVTYPDGHVERFDSITEASEKTGIKDSIIKTNCTRKNILKTGWKFRFVNERSHIGQRNKRKGNTFELKVVHDLNDLGFNVVSSRSESKNKDNDKIDIYDIDGTVPTNIQTKYCNITPNYFNIREACTDKTLPFTVIWKKSTTDGKNSPGTIAMIPYEFFLELIKPFAR